MIRAGNPVPETAVPPSSNASRHRTLAPSQREKSEMRTTWFTRFFVTTQFDALSGRPYRNVFSIVPVNVNGGGTIDFAAATLVPTTAAAPATRVAWRNLRRPTST